MTVDSRDRELSLIQHLDELRRRLVVAAIAVAVTTGGAFFFSSSIVRFLLAPAGIQRCVAFSPTENFTTFLRVALFAGIALAMPVLLYEIYAYVDPALMSNERKFVLISGPFVLLLFLTGMAFCYYLLLPHALDFLLHFGSDVIDNQLRCNEYLSFVTTFILGVGLIFELPALIVALVRIGVVQRSWLAKQRRYVFLASFIAGAIITPTPDPFNQTLVSLPIYFLYELGLLLARFVGGPRRAA
ncbi:MAG: twin-arginine translocase subunit TatC [Chloroflexota bacterium]|nr:twin-arginine translocase subunit TatC [Chloroflexota bacterium]MDE3192516.1 twin-arginine translocase subunit TatC [Chloroflexota bacterium]